MYTTNYAISEALFCNFFQTKTYTAAENGKKMKLTFINWTDCIKVKFEGIIGDGIYFRRLDSSPNYASL